MHNKMYIPYYILSIINYCSDDCFKEFEADITVNFLSKIINF